MLVIDHDCKRQNEQSTTVETFLTCVSVLVCLTHFERKRSTSPKAQTRLPLFVNYIIQENAKTEISQLNSMLVLCALPVLVLPFRKFFCRNVSSWFESILRWRRYFAWDY